MNLSQCFISNFHYNQFRLLQKSKKLLAKRRLQCFCLWNPQTIPTSSKNPKSKRQNDATSSMFSLLPLESSNNSGFFKNPKSEQRNDATSSMFSLLPLESSRQLANVQESLELLLDHEYLSKIIRPHLSTLNFHKFFAKPNREFSDQS